MQTSNMKRPNLREVRRELSTFTETFVASEIEFDSRRKDVGHSIDKLIARRRFGEFGARKVLIAGMDFSSSGT